MGDILRGVVELLGRERPRIPARVARGLADARAENRAEQVAVARLSACAREAGGDLGVEDVVELGSPHAPEDRHVLASRVQHDFDRGVPKQLRERPDLRVRQRVDQRDADPVLGGCIVDGDLDEAQQGPVAPLGHELGVDPEPAAGARERGDGRDLV